MSGLVDTASLSCRMGTMNYKCYVLSPSENTLENDPFIEGCLEVKLPTIWTDGKAQPRRSLAMEKVRREKIRDETYQTGQKV